MSKETFTEALEQVGNNPPKRTGIVGNEQSLKEKPKSRRRIAA